MNVEDLNDGAVEKNLIKILEGLREDVETHNDNENNRLLLESLVELLDEGDAYDVFGTEGWEARYL